MKPVSKFAFKRSLYRYTAEGEMPLMVMHPTDDGSTPPEAGRYELNPVDP
jgi:hypothetical protein